MRFLSPSFLWFLPLALLPLLVNLLFPVKPERVHFSSVFLLRTARDSRVRKAAAAKILILVLRCLVIACLVAGFSRPVAERSLAGPLSGLAAGSGRPLSLAILIDRSLSMNAAFAGRSRRDFAAGAGAGVLAALGPRDEAVPVFFDTEAESGEWTSDFPALSGRKARVPRGFKGTDYRKALEKAYALLAERPSSRLKAVLMLSDGTRNGLVSMRGDIRRLASYDPAVTLACLDIPPVPNSWLRVAGVHEEGGGAFLSAAAETALDTASGKTVKFYA
ncbi:MAG TPA: BatA and WFA domain-containing protein, partial [Elusimicrobiales bacterium]|nr:BatA and WFA domain-containing protein [Elusimicrobiales bacterium]